MPYKLLKIWFFIAKAGLAAEQSPEIDGQGCIITRVTARKIPTLPGGPPLPNRIQLHEQEYPEGHKHPNGHKYPEGHQRLAGAIALKIVADSIRSYRTIRSDTGTQFHGAIEAGPGPGHSCTARGTMATSSPSSMRV
jgi:hypothetical protein